MKEEIVEGDLLFSKAQIASKVADQLLAKFSFVSTGKTDITHLWTYDENAGIWKNGGKALIKSTSRWIAGRGISKNFIQEVIACIMDTRYNSDNPFLTGGPMHKITLKNGVYDLKDGLFSDEFQPLEYHITSIPIEYDPKSKCPNFEIFLSEILDREEDRKAVLEFFGYCLYKSYPIASVLYLIGGGANGKSTLLDVLRAFLGIENVSGKSPQQLIEDKFQVAGLYGKLANICGEIPSKSMKGTDLLKALTGGDLVNAQHKGERDFDFVNYAKLVFSANQLPGTPDDTYAFHRRPKMIKFNRQFSKSEAKDKNLLVASMTTDEELSGILNLAIEGFKRLMKQGEFSGEEEVDVKQLLYAFHSDSAKYFAMTCVQKSTDSVVQKVEMYETYRDVCSSLEIPSVAENSFARTLKSVIPYAQSARVSIDGEQAYVWKGIKVILPYDIQKIVDTEYEREIQEKILEFS